MPTTPEGARTMGSLEKENELRQLLKLARPEWLVPRRKGHSDIQRVMTKLRAIGVTDVESLFLGIDKNTINEDLRRQGLVQFSREATNAIRSKKAFMLGTLKETAVPQVRQTGPYSPVHQMLSQHRLAGIAARSWSPLSSPGASPGGAPRRAGLSATFSEGGLVSAAGLSPAADAGAALPDMGATDEGAFDAGAGAEGPPRLRGARVPVRRRGGAASPSSLAAAPAQGGAAEETILPDAPPLAPAPADADEGDSAASVVLEDSPKAALLLPRRGMPAAAELPPVAGMSTTGGTSGGESPSRRAGGAGGLLGFDGASGQRRARGPAATSSSTGFGMLTSQSFADPGAAVAAVPTGGGLEPPTLEEVRQMRRAASEMLRAPEERTNACWHCLRAKTPSQLGEEMLKEQVELDDRMRLVRLLGNAHGDELAFRSHVARNIRERLREEFRREAGRGPTLAVDQQCINIKKQLDGLVKARGELKGLRAKAQLVFEGDDDGEGGPLAELSLGFRKAEESKPEAKSPFSSDRTLRRQRSQPRPKHKLSSLSHSFELPAVAGALK